MKAVLITAHGGPEVLRYDEVPDPMPGPSEVQVRLEAAALNHLDLWIRRGLPALRVTFPHISGTDGAGTVSAVGPGVRGVKEGDRVVVSPVVSCDRCDKCLSGRHNLCREFHLIGEHGPGCLAEKVVVPGSSVVAAPAGVEMALLAALPTTYMTVWQMLVEKADVQPGELVLVLGVSSGVGVAALQIAKLFGATVIGAASSAEKAARARALGADHTIDTSQEDLVTAVRAISRRGVDIVVEHTGLDTWAKSIQICTKGGRIVTCGATSGYDAPTDLRHIFYRQLTIYGSTMAGKGALYPILEQVAAGRLHPVIDRTFPLAEAAQAQERLESRLHFGKIVLIP